MTSRVVTSWIEFRGTVVEERAREMVRAMAVKESVDSLPPGGGSVSLCRVFCVRLEGEGYERKSTLVLV